MGKEKEVKKNKTILMLINGFGIERSDSTPIYSANLVPNLDKFMQEVIFGTLINPYADYDSGYEEFCIPKRRGEEDEITKMIDDEVLDRNEFLLKIGNSLNEKNTLHVFYILSDYDKVAELRYLIRAINPNKDKKIKVDIVLDSSNVNEYDDIQKSIDKMNLELSGYAELGFVVGKNKMANDNSFRMIYKSLGEHWREYPKKIDVLKRDLTIPENVEPFAIGDEVSIKDGDVIWFVNYQNIKIEDFYDRLKQTKLTFYTLYNWLDGVEFMLKRVERDADSLSGILKSCDINLMIFTDEEHINDLNYYMNGLKKETCDKITYALNDKELFKSKEYVEKLVQQTGSDGFIIDYDLGNFITIKQLKDKLAEIDKVLGSVYEASKEEGYTFIVSSVYGIHMKLKDGAQDKLVNFSGKVPCLYYNSEFPKSAYRVNSGNVHDLALTFLTSIYDDLRQNKLISRGGGFRI